MENKHEDLCSLLARLKQLETGSWTLLTESDLEVLEDIRDIREIVLDIETPDFQISSRT